MPKSEAFARIKVDVLAIARAIPPGRLTSFRAIGAHLDVAPRHVAYILASLTPDEQAAVPWHRVVNEQGRLGRARADADGRSQAELLASEGVLITAAGAVVDFAERFFTLSEATTGVPPGVRPSP